MRNFFTICIALLIVFNSYSQQVKMNLPWVDISSEVARHTIIAKGTPELYNGHPTTVLMEDGKTMFCTWSHNHGGKMGFMSRSDDAGKTWTKLSIPKDWEETSNCPSLYRMTDKKGKERLVIFMGDPEMAYSYSEDLGESWSKIKSLNKPCVMAFSSVIKLKNGDYLGVYHRGFEDKDRAPLTLWASISKDGGVTWEESYKIGAMEGRSPCEPFVLRSPNNGNELVSVSRENNRVNHSLLMFSTDEGKSWGKLKETPWGLTGDRHIIRYMKDGRIVAVFRDTAPGSPTINHFVAWVGSYSDFKSNSSGGYKIKLLHSYAGWDCGYPGLEVLPDGSCIATTYIKYSPGKNKHSIVSVKFNLNETDMMLPTSL